MKKKYLLLILVLVTNNLIGQETIKKSKATIRQTKENLYELSDPINFSDFEVTYNWNNDEKYSTVDSTFRRNYIDGERSVKFVLTKEEKTLIYKTIKETDFFSLPKELEMRNDISISPSFSTEIIIRIGKTTHVVYDSSNLILNHSIAKRFRKIVNVISKIINNKREVMELPESDIVYL